MHSIPTKCPVCAGALLVRRLACERCEVALEGRFGLGALGNLSKEQLAFVEVFLVARGKIKEVEAQLGLSYPTVVSRLEEVVSALRAEPVSEPTTKSPAQIDDVLDALSKGELSPQEAASKLKHRKDLKR
jgi:hypothetical protein